MAVMYPHTAMALTVTYPHTAVAMAVTCPHTAVKMAVMCFHTAVDMAMLLAATRAAYDEPPHIGGAGVREYGRALWLATMCGGRREVTAKQAQDGGVMMAAAVMR